VTKPTGRPRGGPRTPNITKREVKLRLYDPHPGQRRLHESPARFRIACAGRRFGKTYACVNEVAKFAWEHPGNATQHVSWWVAPTYNQAAKALNVFVTYFGEAIASKRLAVGQMSITWKNGSVTAFQSAERYDNLRGEGVELMVVDEAAMVPRAAWEKVLRPMLSDTMGRALLISTPRGKNWFYALYQRGLDPGQSEYESFSFPTIESPYVPDSEVYEAQATLPPDVLAQEYLGEFLEEAAGVFHGIEQCIHGDLEEPDATHRYVIGWDIAKKQDFSVVTVMDTDATRVNDEGIELRTPHVCEWQRFNTLSYVAQADAVEKIVRHFGGYVLLDSTGLGDPIYDMLCARGVPCAPFVFTSRSKQQLIQNLQIAIQTRSISYPELTILLQELGAYQYTISSTGTMQYSAPEGDHDDAVVSLALAAWAAQHPMWNQEPRISMLEEEVISPI